MSELAAQIMQSTLDALAGVPRTITIKFLKPKKLGAISESWLRHDVLGFECTAATCLYFFFRKVRMGARGWSFVENPLVLLEFACERAGRLIGASAGICVPVAVAVFIVVAIF